EPAHHGGGPTARGRGYVLEHAVDAAAHAQPTYVGLEVDVRCPGFERLQQEQVHQLHDGRLVGEADEVVEGGLGVADGAELVVHPRDDVLGGEGVGRVDAADRGTHVGFRQAHQLERRTGQEAE